MAFGRAVDAIGKEERLAARPSDGGLRIEPEEAMGRRHAFHFDCETGDRFSHAGADGLQLGAEAAAAEDDDVDALLLGKAIEDGSAAPDDSGSVAMAAAPFRPRPALRPAWLRCRSLRPR